VTQGIRLATMADADQLLALVDALADYEKLERPDPGARQRIVQDTLGERPRVTALLAFEDAQAVGYALFFETYSSFLALPSLYLEDLFVIPDARGGGHGRALFRAVAAEALRRGCGRMEWNVLKWNELAHAFYRRQHAEPLTDWQMYRLDGDRLRLAAGA